MSITPRVIKFLVNSASSADHIAIGDGQWVHVPETGKYNIEATLDGNGGSATVEVHGSNFGGQPAPATLLATFILSGANDRATEPMDDPGFNLWCTKVVSISGGASVKVVVGG